MTRWLTYGPTGEPPAWRYCEPPASWPRWAHWLACTPCRSLRAHRRAERRRWKIAGLLGRLPVFCWANLAGWALSSRADRRRLDCRPLGHLRVDSICRRDLDASGCCYCGKLRKQPDPAEPSAVNS